jgi:hypothetical protein
MRRIADTMTAFAKTWEFNGQNTESNMQWIILSSRIHHESGSKIIFTRDVDHHLSGWFRNPDYERCWHLSLSPIQPWLIVPGRTIELDREITKMWCKAFFGPHLHLIWAEGPKSKIGKQAGVWHWRVFADTNWEPIKPRGEVYSSRWTERGWKSASEIFDLAIQVPDSYRYVP